jgi:dihydrofolate reductase
LDKLAIELGEEDEVFIIGGASLYSYFMDTAQWLYLTEVKRIIEGDTFFPAFEEHFEEAEREVYDDDLDFVIYRKKRTHTA